MGRLGLLAVAALLVSVPVAAAPGDMSVATFLEKAEKLEKRGVAAMLSSNFNLLKREVEGAGNAYSARYKADEAAGRQPHSCPPQGKLSLNSKDLMAHFRSYPAARRGSTTIKAAFADLMKKRYPCR